jgi:predicted TIM-barrel fold metal-dependent hydrolase
VIKAFGASRIAWGSNFPATAGPLADILKRAQAAFAFATPQEREWIFGKTAQALYPRLAD